MTLRDISDYLKGRLSIAELDNLSTRYVQAYFYFAYKHKVELEKDPKLRESEAMASEFGNLAGM